jgi:hypothetical protein
MHVHESAVHQSLLLKHLMVVVWWEGKTHTLAVVMRILRRKWDLHLTALSLGLSNSPTSMVLIGDVSRGSIVAPICLCATGPTIGCAVSIVRHH